MRKPIAAITVMGALATASPASAAVEVGTNCPSDLALPPATFVPIARAQGSPLPIRAPFAGVVTEWKVELALLPGSTMQQLKVLRPTPLPNEFTLVAESDVETAVGGPNSYQTRIPVQAGDLFGLRGSGATMICQTGDPADASGRLAEDVKVGATRVFEEGKEFLPDVIAVMEPDADGDGFGDETEDRCPGSAASRDACPPVSLELSPEAKKGKVVFLVTASSEAAVTLSATVKLPRKRRRAGRASAQVQLGPVTQTVVPGAISRIVLSFAARLRKGLRALPRKRSLKLLATASAPNLEGAATQAAAVVKLKGQKKTRRPRPKPDKR